MSDEHFPEQHRARYNVRRAMMWKNLFGTKSLEQLRGSVDAWFQAEPERPEDVPASDWLRFEQDKHERLLAAAATLT